MGSPPLVQVQNLSVLRDSLLAVDGVSFALAPETDAALVGPNGAGKSTLVAALLGLLPSSGGSVRILGQQLGPAGELPRSVRSQIAYLALSLRAQVLLTLNSYLAGAFGVGASRHRLAFIVLLAVVVAVSIKAVGVLLISAFVVIPVCAGRLVSRRFPVYTLVSATQGGCCALLGLLGSGLTNLPSGPCVVIVQFLGFVLALLLSQRARWWPAAAGPAGRHIPGAAPAAPGSR